MSEIEERERREQKMILDRSISQARLLPDYGTVRDRIESAKRSKRADKLARKLERRRAG